MANQYTLQLSSDEACVLQKRLLKEVGFLKGSRPYAEFCFEGEGVCVAYFPKKGKLLIQGSRAEAFLESVLKISPTGDAPHVGEMPPGLVDRSPHFGVDESGKGDYFGPLVIAGVYSDERTAEALVRLGCRDSKQIPDDDRIQKMADRVMQLPGVATEIVCIGPGRYNELYAEMGNLNRLLAWGHARVIAALHEKVPACPRALSDQFANEWVLKRALGQRHVPVELEQRPRAESDVAVAAASILARARFVRWMREAAHASGCELPLGCAPHVTSAARAFVRKYGEARLKDVAKLHFRLTARVLE